MWSMYTYVQMRDKFTAIGRTFPSVGAVLYCTPESRNMPIRFKTGKQVSMCSLGEKSQQAVLCYGLGEHLKWVQSLRTVADLHLPFL
jgi:hypothetical protein